MRRIKGFLSLMMAMIFCLSLTTNIFAATMSAESYRRGQAPLDLSYDSFTVSDDAGVREINYYDADGNQLAFEVINLEVNLFSRAITKSSITETASVDINCGVGATTETRSATYSTTYSYSYDTVTASSSTWTSVYASHQGGYSHSVSQNRSGVTQNLVFSNGSNCSSITRTAVINKGSTSTLPMIQMSTSQSGWGSSYSVK